MNKTFVVSLPKLLIILILFIVKYCFYMKLLDVLPGIWSARARQKYLLHSTLTAGARLQSRQKNRVKKKKEKKKKEQTQETEQEEKQEQEATS